MSKTKSVRLFGVIYPGWQDSMFAPSFYQIPPAVFPGAQLVGITVDIPEIGREPLECVVRDVQIEQPTPVG